MFNENEFLDKSLRPITLEEWAKLFENSHYKRIDLTRLWWGGSVSTVWLGLNHQFNPNFPPLVFETIVFSRKRSALFTDRYTNIEIAERRHKEIVREYSKLRYFFSGDFF